MSRPALPERYAFLADEPAPRMLLEALRLYGVEEIEGPEHSAEILSWAAEIGGWVSRFYQEDEVPWCGLFVGIVAKRAGKPVSQDMLGARNWLAWGNPREGEPMLGDVMVFSRGNRGGHVGLYVGEDPLAFHILGGNQGNRVSIVRVSRSRFLGARNFYAIGEPSNVRRIDLGGNRGRVSTDEA